MRLAQAMEELKVLTGGRGPDASIEAVGMETHGSTYDHIKQTLKLETDRPCALRQAIYAARARPATCQSRESTAGFSTRFPLALR